GLPGPPQDAPVAGAQREDVARLDEVSRRRRGVDGDPDRVRAIGGRDAGRHPLARLDRDRERGAEPRLVVVGHRAQPERVAALLGQAQADEAARVRRHEVDRLGGGELGGDHEVALVLAVRIVDDDDEAAVADVLERLLDRGERGGLPDGGHRSSLTARLTNPAYPRARASSRSTYFASTSTSRFTSSPGASAPRVVAASVCGTSATAKPSASTAATVSETPASAIEPFS